MSGFFFMRFWFLFFVLPLFASCISQSTLFHGIDDSKINTDHISGAYANDPDENAAPLAWRLSRMQRKFKEEEVYPKVDVVLLEYQGDEELHVDFYENDMLVDHFTLRVKNNGDHLEIKRRLRLVPIPILFWLHDERRCLLMNDPEGNLMVSNANFQAIFFLTMARSKSWHGVADYNVIPQ